MTIEQLEAIAERARLGQLGADDVDALVASLRAALQERELLLAKVDHAQEQAEELRMLLDETLAVMPEPYPPAPQSHNEDPADL